MSPEELPLILALFSPIAGLGVVMEVQRRWGFFSRRTLWQLVLYGVVGVYEAMVGYQFFIRIPLPATWAFYLQSGAIGFTAFVMRKLVFEHT